MQIDAVVKGRFDFDWQRAGVRFEPVKGVGHHDAAALLSFSVGLRSAAILPPELRGRANTFWCCIRTSRSGQTVRLVSVIEVDSASWDFEAHPVRTIEANNRAL